MSADCFSFWASPADPIPGLCPWTALGDTLAYNPPNENFCGRDWLCLTLVDVDVQTLSAVE